MGLDFNNPRRSKKRLGLALVCLALILLSTVFSASVSAQPARLTGTVARVIDGDTFKLDGLEPSIRIWGLDAPEADQSQGPRATRALRHLILSQHLSCVIRDIDKYQRIVGQCFLSNGRDITAEMIRLGVATEYCYFSKNHYGTC